jgi:hypothetical protein
MWIKLMIRAFAFLQGSAQARRAYDTVTAVACETLMLIELF